MPDTAQKVLGIVGAGKIGTAVARAAVAAGYDVVISGSGATDRIALTVEILARGARAATTAEVVNAAEMIVLALPTHRFRRLARDLFAGKILIDAMNYWQPVDGDDDELAFAPGGSSTVVQQYFASAYVVKSLNQLGYHQFDEHQRPRGAPDRIAIGVATNHPGALIRVGELIDDLGYDPIDAGTLPSGTALGPKGPAFGVALTAAQLRTELRKLAV